MAQDDDIRFVDNSAYAPSLVADYVLLGMLRDYICRSDPGGDIAEWFYPTEQLAADLFQRHARSVTKNEVARRVRDTGHIEIVNPSLKARLEHYYKRSEGSSHYMTLRDDAFPPITTRQYIAAEMDPRFSYLYGVYLRYAATEQFGFVFANSYQRVQLVIEFLSAMDVRWMSHKFTVNTAPIKHEVSFEPDHILRDWLARAAEEKASAGQLLGDAPGK